MVEHLYGIQKAAGSSPVTSTKITDAEAAWVAGLLEGEGYFTTKSGAFTPTITCESTDEDVVRRLHVLLGGTVVMPKKRQTHWKQSWVWRQSGENAAETLKKILPWMGSRRSERIETMLAVWHEKGLPHRERSKRTDRAVKYYLEHSDSIRAVARQFDVDRVTLTRRIKTAQ